MGGRQDLGGLLRSPSLYSPTGGSRQGSNLCVRLFVAPFIDIIDRSVTRAIYSSSWKVAKVRTCFSGAGTTGELGREIERGGFGEKAGG